MLNMDTSYFSDSVIFSPSRGVGMDEAGLWRASVMTDAACVPVSSGGIIGNLFCSGKSSIVSETRYDTVLGM